MGSNPIAGSQATPACWQRLVYISAVVSSGVTLLDSEKSITRRASIMVVPMLRTHLVRVRFSGTALAVYVQGDVYEKRLGYRPISW